jgi:hypothetical protein
MSESLVTIAQFHGSTDAAVAKTAMDTAGIESEVEDVRLEVHNEDAYRAFHVLDTSCPTLPVIEEAYEEPVALARVCAECGSEDVASAARFTTFGGIAALGIGIGVAVGLTDAAFFAIGAAGLFLLMADRWRCADCGASWN